MLKILYLGYAKAGRECLLQLLNEKEIKKENIFIITYNNKKNKQFLDLIKNLGMEYTTEFIRQNFVYNKILKFQPDLILSIYFRDIVPNKVLNCAKIACVNLHSALLPEYKGCFASFWAIMNGEKETGITYHYMTEKVDSGNIILQEKFIIDNNETAYSLYNRLLSLGVRNFLKMFDLVFRQRIKGREQKSTQGKMYKREIPFNGFFSLDWSKEEIDRFIRAMYFPLKKGVQLKYKNRNYEFRTIQKFNEFCKENNIIL